jgi:hypothetical protein
MWRISLLRRNYKLLKRTLFYKLVKIFCFCYFSISNSGYTVFNGRIIVNVGVGNMWKEAVVIWFDVYPDICLEVTGKVQNRNGLYIMWVFSLEVSTFVVSVFWFMAPRHWVIGAILQENGDLSRCHGRNSDRGLTELSSEAPLLQSHWYMVLNKYDIDFLCWSCLIQGHLIRLQA